jgi:predicted glycoside hydrolase/deacetylase ChbG (UPF0249 family)
VSAHAPPSARTAGIPIILCADDYGIAPGVSRAIRDLIARRVLTATGCMTAGPWWPEEGAALRPLSGLADCGLHITLTDQAPLGAMARTAPEGKLPSLGALTLAAYTGRLDCGEIAAEIDRQIARFAAVVGAPPKFLDGHQHVHQLPTVRDLVIARARNIGAYLRYATEPLPAIVRRGVAVARTAVISVMGAGLRTRGEKAGIPGCSVFRGVRDFSPRESYPRLFPRYLERPVPGMMVACHPGLVDDALRAVDPVTAPREGEYRYFMGEAFARDLAAAGVRLVRGNEGR